MRRRALIVALGAAAAAGGGIWYVAVPRAGSAPAEVAAPSPDHPGGRPIDAARVSAGRLAVEVMPPEVTGALELHSAEIVRTAEQLASKQARITGTCAPGSAIRIVNEDGRVVCQRLPRGVASVAAVAGVPRLSSTGTAQGTVAGGVGRFQISGEDDFLVVPVHLPEGATVTGFAYTYWDADARVDGAAYLYRSDDTVLAGIATDGAAAELRHGESDRIAEPRVDNAAHAYFVYFQISAEAGANLMPVAAAVTYRLP